MGIRLDNKFYCLQVLNEWSLKKSLFNNAVLHKELTSTYLCHNRPGLVRAMEMVTWILVGMLEMQCMLLLAFQNRLQQVILICTETVAGK